MHTLLSARTLAVAAFAVTTALHAQVPQLVNYQGRVAVNGVNFEGTGQFKFALVQGTGSTLLWKNDGLPGNTEPSTAVALAVTKGLYSVLLGDVSTPNMAAIPASVWGNPDVRLRIWFNNGTNGSQLLNPDQRLAPNGYLPDGAVTSSKIPDGTISSAKITPQTITGDRLAPATLTASHLSPIQPTAGQVLSYNGGSLAWTSPGDGVFSLAGTTAFYNGGNVGIGTDSPGARLTIHSPSITNAENTVTFVLGSNLSQSHIHYGTTGDWYIRSASASGKVILQDSGGNVGIGTTSPETKLHVKNGAIKAEGGLIIEKRGNDPQDPEDGRIWLRTDL